MVDRQVVSVFVSSVFRDMHTERDLLNRFVIPDAQERLRSRGNDCTIQCVDLRWGLNADEATETHKIVQLCLEEIDRAKPYFLCILGQSYGSETDSNVSEALAREFDFDVLPGSHSVTDIEIQFALRLKACFETAPLFVLREPPPGEEDDPKMLALKRRVQAEAPENIAPYQPFDGVEKRDEWIAWMSDRLVEWLEPQLQADASADLDPVQEHERQLEVFLADVAERTVARTVVTSSVADRIASETESDSGPRVLLLAAAPGAGKTTVAASLPQQLDGRGFLTLSHFVDASDNGYSVEAMLRRFCDKLGEASGRGRPTKEQWAEADPRAIFASLLNAASAERPVAVVIDTLEEMEPGPLGQLLTWWPRSIRGDAALLVTCREPQPVAQAWSLNSGAVLGLPALSVDEATALVTAACRRRRRNLPHATLHALLAKRTADGMPAYANPLWTLMLVEELNLLDSDDFASAASFSGDGGARITQLLSKLIDDAPSELGALYQFVFERTERSLGREMVASFMAHLSITRRGLRPSDLLALRDKVVAAAPSTPLMLSQLRHRLRAQLNTSGVGGAWRLQHATALEAGRARYLPSDEAARIAHTEVAAHLSDLPLNDILRLEEYSYHLWKSEQALELSRAVAHARNHSDARTLLEATDARARPLFDIYAALANPALSAFDAIALAKFLSEHVVYQAKRQGSVSSQVAILEQVDAGLSSRAGFATEEERRRLDHERARLAVHTFIRLNSSGDLAKAHELFTGALKTMEALSAQDPSSLELLDDLYTGLEIAGHSSLNMNDLETAIEQFGRAVEIARRRLSLRPSQTRRRGVSFALTWLGVALLARSGPAAALPIFEEARAQDGRAAMKTDGTAEQLNVNTMALEYLLDVKVKLNDLNGACTCGEELVTALKRTVEADPGDFENLRRLSTARLFLAPVLAELGDQARAENEFALSIRGMLTVLKAAPDDVQALRNVCSGVAMLDQHLLRQLRLTSKPAYSEEITRLTETYERWKEDRHVGILVVYAKLARQFLDAKLILAAEIAIARCIWWASRFRGEAGEPSCDAFRDASKVLGESLTVFSKLKLEFLKHCRETKPGFDAPLPPALLSPLDIEARTAPLDLSDFEAVTEGVGASMDAILRAVQSARAHQGLNTLRWVECAESLVARVEALGVDFETRSKNLLAQLRASVDAAFDEAAKPLNSAGASSAAAATRTKEGGAYAKEVGGSVKAEPVSRERSTEVAERFKAALNSRMAMAEAERRETSLEFFREQFARTRGEYGALLYEPDIAEPLLWLGLMNAIELRACGHEEEATYTLELIADVVIGVEDARRTEMITEHGLMAIAMIYEFDLGRDWMPELNKLRARTEFALQLGEAKGATVAARRIAAQLLGLLARRLVMDNSLSEEAERLSEKSAKLREGVYHDSQDRDDGLDLSSQWNAGAEIKLQRSKTVEAAALFEKALAFRRKLLAEAEGSPAAEAKIQYYLAGSLTRLAGVRIAENEPLAAADLFLEAEEIRAQQLRSGAPDLDETAATVWWIRSRAADCLMEGGDIKKGLHWAKRSNEVLAELFHTSPSHLSRVLSGVGSFTSSAEEAASEPNYALWKAWMERAKLTLDALQKVGAPLQEFGTLIGQLEVSRVFGGPTLPSVNAEVLACFDAARRRDIGTFRNSLVRSVGSKQERDALSGMLDGLELEAAGSVDKAAMRITRALEEYGSSAVCDQRISTMLQAHRVRLLSALNLGEWVENERRFVRFSALLLFGPESREASEIDEVLNEKQT